MKKMKKAIAILLASTVCLVPFSGFSASAIADTPVEITLPEGYVEVDDSESLFFASASSLMAQWWLYPVPEYRVWESDEEWLVLHFPEYNYLSLSVVDSDAVWSIYYQYQDALDFDYVSIQQDGNGALFYDYLNEDGEESFDVSEFEDKSEIVQEFYEKLYEAGAVSGGTFKSSLAYAKRITKIGILIAGLTTDDFTELCEITASVSADAVVENSDKTLKNLMSCNSLTYDDDALYYFIDDIGTFDEIYTLWGTLTEAFPEAEVTMVRNGWEEGAVEEEYASETIDLQAMSDTDTEIEPTLFGDVNTDGEITLSDTIRLQNAASGVLTLDGVQKANADLNQDGSIDATDALLSLKYQIGVVAQLPYLEA